MNQGFRLKQMSALMALLSSCSIYAQNVDAPAMASVGHDAQNGAALAELSPAQSPTVLQAQSLQVTPTLTAQDKQVSAEVKQKVIAPTPANEDYTWKTAQEDLKAIKWEAGGTFAGITAIGVKSWKWGSSSFHFNGEHWFGKKTGSGGTDKLGHAFTSYTLTNAFAERLQAQGRSPERAALSAALLTQALMLYVEIFDGVSGDHGFSKEDMVMNAVGIGMAYLRQTHPRLKELVDYRMEYNPSGYKGFRPLSDYEGQKYLLALKLSGIPSLKKTPLKYVELQAGYYTRGFSKQAKADNQVRTRHGFVGVGINLSQLVFGSPEPGDTKVDKAGRFVFEHIQIPSTAIRSENEF